MNRLSPDQRIRHLLEGALRAEAVGDMPLARTFRRMAQDLAPAPAERRSR